MRAIKFLVIAAVALSAAAVMAMPRNSYLVRPAHTIDALVQQVKSEPAVMDRYMRHFSMTREEVLDYLGSLHAGRVDHSGVYTVWGVPEGGKIHMRPQNLRKGALVWMDSNNELAILEVCGNPMSLGPKKATMAAAVMAAPVTVPNEIAPMTATVQQPVISQPVMAEMVPITPTVPVHETIVEPAQVTRGSGLGGLLLVPAAIAIASRRGGCPCVPEPASMTALFIGGSALAAKLRRKS